jgi:DNA-binding transcriptional ArsR family regulator
MIRGSVSTPTISEETAPKLAEMLKALGHPVRLRIVSLLCVGDMRVSELALELGARQSLVSQQLRILRMIGLVEVTRESGVARYTLAEPRLVDLLRCMTACRRI